MSGIQIKTMAQFAAEGKMPEVLFWVGCSGSFDDRAKKVTRAFVKILNKVGIEFGVLGTEESCTGDPAKRAGNEFLFQMQAMSNIQVLDGYGIKKIVTICPHGFNTIKNEYPALGGHYEILHHSQYLQQLIDEGRLVLKDGGTFKGKRITFHDPCYLGRGNDIYAAPRSLIEKLDAELVEMKHFGKKSLCCGAGGAQFFKEPEKGDEDINAIRTQEAVDVKANIIATACPFCITMMSDGVKNAGQEGKMEVKDLAELIVEAEDL